MRLGIQPPSVRKHYSQMIWDMIDTTVTGFGFRWFFRKVSDSIESESYLIYVSNDFQSVFKFYVEFRDRGILIKNIGGPVGNRNRVSIQLNNIDLTDFSNYLCDNLVGV